MDKYYTDERSTQILISLLKEHGIKKVIASPGATNVCFIGSIQNDPFFEIYSSVDERSAAYIACGLSAESGEPVALSCTGATASRNYMSALTQAYYRKIPIIAITSTQHTGRIGQLIPQVIDRTTPLNDIVKLSVQIPITHCAEDEWACEVLINKALLELRRGGGGPVHINLTTTYSRNFNIKELPSVRVIKRIGYIDNFPELVGKKVGIYIGAHKKFDQRLTSAVDKFCEIYNAVAFCDHTSNYDGKYRFFGCLLSSQAQYESPCRKVDIMIHIGDVSGSDFSLKPSQVWRVNPDGEVRDTFRRLQYVFEMEELDFFEKYSEGRSSKNQTYWEECIEESNKILNKIPELPFSNVWIAQHTVPKLPKGCILHLGILNTLRTWNFFESDKSILGYANTGGFGIDGCVSSLIGAALARTHQLYFGIVGDLSFFYDMNSIGNRHVGNNIRLMVINNGRGTEFRNYNHPAARFDIDADKYMAAAGHFGQQSAVLIKHYAEDLGFKYLCASEKQEYIDNLDEFVDGEFIDKPILFEVFTDSKNESDAIEIMNNLEMSAKGVAKNVVKDVLGPKRIKSLKKLMKQ